MTIFNEQDLSGATFRECDLTGARFVGVAMSGADIDGHIDGLVVNGVEVAPYVEAELDRRHPERPLLRSDDPAELREGWATVQGHWRATEERIAALPGAQQRARVDDEWSAIETLRHLVYATDCWLRRAVLGVPEPFWPGGLTWEQAPSEYRLGADPDADPTLLEVLTARRERVDQVTSYLDSATVASLAEPATGAVGPGWPPPDHGRSVGRCLRTVLNEEFWHHRFCVRDLDKLAAGSL